MNIYLIGMPGCGKSTIGKRLAEKLDLNFIDTDKLIEKQKNMTISDIFSCFGENYFRKLETSALEELTEKDSQVVSTGGGIILKEENKKLLNGKVFYLKIDTALLLDRTKAGSRPLLKTKSLNDIFDERKEKYINFADEIIDINNLSIDEIVEKIINLI